MRRFNGVRFFSIKIIVPTLAILTVVVVTLANGSAVDALGGVADVLNIKRKGVVTVESRITRVDTGDVNKNGKLDAGDTIHMAYEFENTTKDALTDMTLYTNINRNDIHFIQNERGTTGMTRKGDTLEIPNIRLEPNQKLKIEFDARTNFSKQPKVIKTRPSLKQGSRELATHSETKIEVIEAEGDAKTNTNSNMSQVRKVGEQ